MNHRATMRWLVLVAGFWTGTTLAAETPWGDGYPEYTPDTDALHDRLPHDHSGDGPFAPEGSVKTPPVPIVMVEPEFPHTALEQVRIGWVFLEFMVGTDGKPYDIEVLAQDYQELFGEKAKLAIARWRFKPATVNGEPTKWRVTLPIEFRRPIRGYYEIPRLHEASLASPLKLPVQASDGLEQADIVFLPMFDNLFGSPELGYVHAQKWVAGDVIPLDLEGMNDDLIIMLPKGDASNLEVSPARARIARVVPTGISGENVRFTDATGRTLILVYADREATIRGESAVGSVTLHHRIDLPGAGFYWVEFRQGADGLYESAVVNDVDQPRITIRK